GKRSDVGEQVSTNKKRSVEGLWRPHLFSANGAVFLLAVRHRTDSPRRTWGIAPRYLGQTDFNSAESATSARPVVSQEASLIRASSARFLNILLLGRCPRLGMNDAPLALNTYLTLLGRRAAGLPGEAEKLHNEW